MGWYTGGGGGVKAGSQPSEIPGAFETISVGDAAKGLNGAYIAPTSGTFAGREAKGAYLTLETGDLRYRLDGSDPTADVGHLWRAETELVLMGAQTLRDVRFIRDDATNGVISVTYFY